MKHIVTDIANFKIQKVKLYQSVSEFRSCSQRLSRGCMFWTLDVDAVRS